MAEKARDPSIAALEAVYAALKNLDPNERKRVLSSVFALLGLEGAAPSAQVSTASVKEERRPIGVSSRPMGLVELVNEKQPGSNAQRIALFAYYREKYEGVSRFGRDDLKPYFATAKQPPAANFDRDFVEAVKKGWIHEDASDSYLTTKGIEAVESGFESTGGGGRRASVTPKRAVKKKKAKKKNR